MYETKNIVLEEEVKLETGVQLSGLHLAYTTYGELNSDQSNVVWIVHALTANSIPTEWWPNVVGDNCVINPEDHFIICVNNPGSPYGSFSPLSINQATGEPYYHDFPTITTKDIALIYSKLKKQLGLDKIQALVGASMGGQIAMEMAIIEQKNIDHLILIATNAKHSPWGIAFNESQRLAIEADQTWKEKNPDAGLQGMKAARAIALLSYRTARGYNYTQKDEEHKIEGYRATTYQQYQGDKLTKRYNAFSYYSNTKTMDSHNVGRGKKDIPSALGLITAKTTIIGITTDLLFPIEEQKLLQSHIERSEYHEIESFLGHDGFLTEFEKVSEILSNSMIK
jgi:homoserine O-acetyltransferase/O-succinyltransferase